MAKALVRPIEKSLMKREPVWLLTEGDHLVLRQGDRSARSERFVSVPSCLDQFVNQLPEGTIIDGVVRVIVGHKPRGKRRHYTIITAYSEEDHAKNPLAPIPQTTPSTAI